MARTKQGKAPASKATARQANPSALKKQYSETELEWVVTTVSGYIPDGFHGYCEPEREVSTLEDVSPSDREQAIEMLKEKMGQAFSGWEWEEIEERTEVDVRADEPGRYAHAG
jgi:hypothetical protein